MGLISWLKATPKTAVQDSGRKQSLSGLTPPPQDDLFKAYIPNFLYKPPFGYPLNKNILQLRQLAKNPYVFSVIRTLKDEASTAKWEIKVKKEYADEGLKGAFDENIKNVSGWFYNPNGNEESFGDIVGQWVQDLCEVDAAVGVKVFNGKEQFSQLFARDGGSFLKNPNIYGYLGERSEFVLPLGNYGVDALTMPDKIKVYGAQYSESAAYFQYGWTGNALPVPFGRREIIYICANPRSDSIYGRSPIEILQDILLTLIYGAQYNMDYYINGNTPDGLINLVGADVETAKAFQDRMRDKFKQDDPSLGFNRRVGHRYPVWGGPQVNFIPFQLSSKDMEVIEQQKWFTKLVWSAFGVTPDQMGYTEDSNKAVSQTQTGVYKKKALKPMLKKIEYAINTQIMPELDPTGKLEFAFEDYDIDEELKKMTLYKMQIDAGIKTAEMVAEEEGIDITKLKEQKAEQQQQELDKMQAQFQYKADAQPPQVKGDFVNMKLDELIEEHKKLVKVLESDNPKEIKQEAENQKKELEEYIEKKKDPEVKASDSITEYFNRVRKHLLDTIDKDGSRT